MARSIRRRSVPSSPAKSREATTSPRQTRRSSRIQSREAEQPDSGAHNRQLFPLHPVPEHNDTINVHQPLPPKETHDAADVLEHQTTDDLEKASIAPSSGQLSEDSNFEQLDHRAIIDKLVRIDDAADDILDILEGSSVPDIADEMAKQDSPARIYLEEKIRDFKKDLNPCGRKHLLDLFKWDSLFMGELLPFYGVGLILEKANLAYFLLILVGHDISEPTVEIDGHLERLVDEDPFPEPFAMTVVDEDTASMVEDDPFLLASSKLGISIMTQYFLRTASAQVKNKDFNPLTLLQNIFFDESDHLRDLSLNRVQSTTSIDFQEAVKKRFRELRQGIAISKNVSRRIQILQKRYPWESFLTEAGAWIRERRKQLELALKKADGAAGIKQALKLYLPSVPIKGGQSTREAREALADKEMEDGASFLRDVDEGLDVADDGSQAQAEGTEENHSAGDVGQYRLPTANKAVYLHPQPPDTIPESPQPDREIEHVDERSPRNDLPDDNIAVTDDEAGQNVSDPTLVMTSTPRPTQETLNVLRITQRQERESNKENSPPRQIYRLLDQQPNATRVTFDDDKELQQGPNHGKRPRQELSDDEEDDFETDTRLVKKPRPLNGKAPIPHQPHGDQAEEGTFVTDSDDSGARVRQHRQIPSNSGKRRQENDSAASHYRPGDASTQPLPRSDGIRNAGHDDRTRSSSSPAPPPSTYAGYMEVRQQARQNFRDATLISTAASSGFAAHQPQIRKAWTEEEIQRLMDLMKEYGTSWSKIKQMDIRMTVPLLTGRSQVQCKDKARNLKLDFLRAEQPLPDYLMNVTISKAHKEELMRRGIALPRGDAVDDS